MAITCGRVERQALVFLVALLIATFEQSWAHAHESDSDIAHCFGNTNVYSFRLFEKPPVLDDAALGGRALFLTVRPRDPLDVTGAKLTDFEAGRGIPEQSISYLFLSGSSLTKEDWTRLKRLSALRVIRICDCSLTDHDMQMLGTFAGLEDLRINGTEISAMGLRSLADCPKLMKLSLGRYVSRLQGRRRIPKSAPCRINSIMLREVSALKKLKSLNLSGLPFDESVVEHLCQIPQLQELDITETNATDSCLFALIAAKSLRTLLLRDDPASVVDEETKSDRGHCEVTARAVLKFMEMKPACKVAYFHDRVLSSVTSIAELEKKLSFGMKGASTAYGGFQLRLRYSGFTDEGMTWIAKLADITELDIEGCSVSDVGADYIAQMRSLKELRAVRTNITAVGAKSLKQLPDLRAIWIDSVLFNMAEAREALRSLSTVTTIVVIAAPSEREQALEYSKEFNGQQVFVPTVPR